MQNGQSSWYMSRLVSSTDCPITVALCTMAAVAVTFCADPAGPAAEAIADAAARAAAAPGPAGVGAGPVGGATSSSAESCAKSPVSSCTSSVPASPPESMASPPAPEAWAPFAWLAADAIASQGSWAAGTAASSKTCGHMSPLRTLRMMRPSWGVAASPLSSNSACHCLRSATPYSVRRSRCRFQREDEDEAEDSPSSGLVQKETVKR
mmetsp:Transcript_104272/g.299864  ORF Transcript_104272/g.299864 Transcript_104272/m.299864 type:complete len:208 (-) Transcript_104272:2005-2628(-)